MAFASKGLAQPKPCGPNPAMTPTCATACVICDIDGFSGINNSNIVGQAPPDFCTSHVHHMQWIAFIAGSEDLTIEFSVFNCHGSNGLEVGIYESNDCTNFSLVTDCDTDIDENSVRIFKNKRKLTIGQHYYFAMDGSNGDICDYSIKVLEGSTKVSPLENAPAIMVPELICQSREVEFSTPGIIGASIYDWFVNSELKASTTKFKTSFAAPGEYEICLDARNACDKAPRICKKIKVLPLSRFNMSAEVCFGQCFPFLGNDYCATGKYDVILQAANGCDSIITLDVKIKDEIIVNQHINLCEGDTLKIGEDYFTSEGPHTANTVDANGCKIKINLMINLIKCTIKGSSTALNARCNGLKNGKIEFVVTNGSPPLKFTWTRLESINTTGSGIIESENQVNVIDNLDEGTYLIEIADGYGNRTVLTGFVDQPPPLKADFETIDFNGYDEPCFGDALATLTVKASGGNGNYDFIWSNNATTTMISKLPAAEYRITVTDQLNCTLIKSYHIKEPKKLVVTKSIHHPDCSGPNTGIITIENIDGGVMPYIITFNDQEYQNKLEFDQLTENLYTTSIKDKNGCDISGEDTLIAASIPLIQYQDHYITELGNEIEMNISSSLIENKVKWTPSEGLSCSDCLSAKIIPLNDTKYRVDVTSVDGCTRSAMIDVEVKKNRSFLVSNILTANGDKYNDNIKYFTANDVSEVLSYQIYDRWGSMIFEVTNSGKGFQELSFNGISNGRKLTEGNYVWIAKVRYIDGIDIIHSGSLAIVR